MLAQSCGTCTPRTHSLVSLCRKSILTLAAPPGIELKVAKKMSVASASTECNVEWDLHGRLRVMVPIEAASQ
jgi:hypothetical protein